MKKILKCIFWIIAKIVKAAILVIEKIIWELALIAALLSLAISGPIFDRVIGGMRKILLALFAFGEAYYQNTDIDKFMTGFSISVQNVISLITVNIKKDPQTVLIAFIATFFCYKVASLILKLIRKKVLRCGCKCHGKSNDDDKKGKTYEQLYTE
ncbi:MAG: hypothetical protein HN337_04555 [Deltaproteobacteria bacterium]|jgi:hypothetical protein|nr:hypothetical protein [Deltaproteobacteria bacterium]